LGKDDLPVHERGRNFNECELRSPRELCADDNYQDVGAAGLVKQLLCAWSGDMDAAMRLNTGITLVKRFAFMIEQRKIHVVFAWEFAAAVTAESPRSHLKHAGS
jgi:hypothetical protein